MLIVPRTSSCRCAGLPHAECWDADVKEEVIPTTVSTSSAQPVSRITHSSHNSSSSIITIITVQQSNILLELRHMKKWYQYPTILVICNIVIQRNSIVVGWPVPCCSWAGLKKRVCWYYQYQHHHVGRIDSNSNVVHQHPPVVVLVLLMRTPAPHRLCICTTINIRWLV